MALDADYIIYSYYCDCQGIDSNNRVVYNIPMICAADNCNRNDSKRRLKMGYCDAHYQRFYFNKDIEENNPVKEYAKRGTGLKLIMAAVKQNNERCLDWPLGQDSRGYGAIFYKGKRYKAHRLTRIIFDGIDEPPSDVFACHRCDNRLCYNPNHVYWGTAKTNKQDQYAYYNLKQ